MNTIIKDLLTVDKGIIIHQVNCQGAMNSGIAKAIREKWPNVYLEYKRFWALNCPAQYLLGRIQTIEIKENDLYIINLFGQENYGYDGKRYTSYGAWEKALPEIKHAVEFLRLTPYFAYKTGCDRGGGDWEIISRLINEFLPEAVICKL